MLTAFGLLAKLRGLRGTPFDIFGRTAERRAERRLIAEYEAVLDEIAQRLSPENQAVAVELAAVAAGDPRLRPHQGSQFSPRQGESGGAAGAAARALAAACPRRRRITQLRAREIASLQLQ